jgi:TonB family protein
VTRLHRVLVVAAFLIAVVVRTAGSQNGPYYPSADNWERRPASELGMNDARLAEAVEWAQRQDRPGPRTFDGQAALNGRLLGPLPAGRAGVNGIVIRRGYIVAEFGDTARPDPSYSVVKSYLSTLAGLAVDRGLIPSVRQPVGAAVGDGGYDSPHNAKITWEHHLRHVSEWDGTLFGKPSNFVGAAEFGQLARERPGELFEPGTNYEYNDVRINRLALSLLRVWKRPLPEVLRTEIMDPIGASPTWQYLGYDNAAVMVDGRRVTSVPGGTRWGGGLWMNTRDHARFGYLMLRRGEWAGRQIVSPGWIAEATTPSTALGNDYGYLWYTNTKGTILSDAPRSSFSAQGDGPNLIWIDPDNDLVVVWRWFDGPASEFIRRILAAIDSPQGVPATPVPTTAGILRVGVNGLGLPTPVTRTMVTPPAGASLRGRTAMEIVLAEDGRVETVRIIGPVIPPQPELDAAAVAAAQRDRYLPTIVDGVAQRISFNRVVDWARVAELLVR